MPRPSPIAACIVCCLVASQAARAAGDGRESRIAIARTTLNIALPALARQTGADIVSTEPGLDRVVVRPLRGRMSARRALDRLLAGTPLVAERVDATSFRIVRRPVRTRPARAPAAPPPVSAPAADVVVTASKHDAGLLRFPGSVTVIDLREAAPLGHVETRSLGDVAAVTPLMQKTELGAGRNKLFIRGIADSSFNGPTQATASVYFGDVQLGYSGPDPALRLYDVEKIEVLEGPQGTLYGAGAIGGIVRITPAPVDLTRSGGAVMGGVTAMAGGDSGFDLGATANLALVDGRMGLRGVAYRVRDGGYLDDAARRLRNVNGAVTDGGRLTLAIRPDDAWSIEIGALHQRIDAADAQYAERGAGALDRRSAFAQPYGSDITLGRVVVGRTWDSGVQLSSSTGLVGSRARDVFDATRNRPGSGPTIYTNRVDSRLLTHEMRVFRTLPDGRAWLVGGAILRARGAQSRGLGPLGSPATIVGVTNRTESASLFAEGTLAPMPTLSITAGGRLTRARTDGNPSDEVRVTNFVRGRTTTRFDPTIAASGLIAPRLALFARYQSGFRTGGLAVARGIGRVEDFRSDAIHVVETGARFQPIGPRVPSLSVALSFARWRNIQADLVDRRGLPFTANIGDARIVGLESSGRWSPVAGVEASFSMLYTFNEVSGPIAASSRRSNRRLPETPAISGAATLGYRWTVGKRDRFAVAGNAHYVGRSVLGTGDFFDIAQGRYAVAGASAEWTRGVVTTSLTIDNIGNARSNQFALGNPFLLATRNQSTPLVPTRLRLGTTVRW